MRRMHACMCSSITEAAWSLNQAGIAATVQTTHAVTRQTCCNRASGQNFVRVLYSDYCAYRPRPLYRRCYNYAKIRLSDKSTWYFDTVGFIELWLKTFFNYTSMVGFVLSSGIECNYCTRRLSSCLKFAQNVLHFVMSYKRCALLLAYPQSCISNLTAYDRCWGSS